MSVASEAASAPTLRAGGKLSYLFGLGLTAAAGLTAVAVWLASSPEAVQGGDRLRVVYAILAVNLLLILSLAGMIVWRIRRLTVMGDAGAKLHLRFMTLFALAAVAPAMVVAFFFGILVNQGVENSFSEPIRRAMQNYATINADLQATQIRNLEEVVDPAAALINETMRGRTAPSPDMDGFLFRLMDEASFRSIHLLDSEGRVLVSAEAAAAPPFMPPDAEAFAEAGGAGFAATRLSVGEDLVRILVRLRDAPGFYAWIAAPLPTGLLARLRDSEAAYEAYLSAQASRNQVQAVFMASYVETALLVLLGAIWLGMTAASSITEPVTRLVKAANQVAAGDLSVRVETDSQLEAIETLSHSFNRMTDDIKRQQSDLLAVSLDAENRRQFIETVLSGVSAGVLGVNADGRISAVNRQALTLLDISEGAARGARLSDVAPELADIASRAVHGEDAEAEIDLLRGSEARRLRVRAGGDPKDGLVLTFDDITRLVAAQRNAAWKDVARRIAHEIKNPLTPIQLSAERLRRKYRKEITSDLETFDRCTDTIVRQVGDIGRMVDEFSAFARMPAPKFGPCDASEMLRAAVFAQRVANPEIEIALEEQPASGPVICDDRMIGQALTNVLKNAAEAVEARSHRDPGHEGRISARLREDGEMLIFEVEDNGIGLPAKDRARLTEPYVTTREKGTGLGLAIVKRIMEDHGGTLSLRDGAGGGGALVVLSFPRGEAFSAQAPLTAEA